MSKENNSNFDNLVEDSFKFKRLLQILRRASSCEDNSMAKPILDNNPSRNSWNQGYNAALYDILKELEKDVSA